MLPPPMASLSQIFLILVVISCPSLPISSGGSRKELRDKKNTVERQSSYVFGSKSVDPRRVLQLSWQPRVFLYRGFLSEEECDHLAKETSEGKSGDADGKTQLSRSDHVLDVPDPIVAGIEERISAWTFLPRVLFFTRHLNATLDQTSTHFRCPVLKGELLVATKLIYAKKQARKDEEEESGECSDEDESCGKWAELGECEKNPVYMIGSPDYFGTCRKSCNAC